MRRYFSGRQGPPAFERSVVGRDQRAIRTPQDSAGNGNRGASRSSRPTLRYRRPSCRGHERRDAPRSSPPAGLPETPALRKEPFMLVLSRHRDESIIIGDDIVVTIVDIRGDKVRLGIEAPTEIPVHRREVYEAIQRENLRASQLEPKDTEGLEPPRQRRRPNLPG